MKAKGEKIVSLTAYDYFTAALLDAVHVDFILVGDSLANVVQGHDTTIPVTLEETIYHTEIVVRKAPDALVIADMPFGSFNVSAEETVKNCVRVFKETGCGGVKLEGASPSTLEAVSRLSQMGVPVMGHIGLKPQSVHTEGGYHMHGRDEQGKGRLKDEARMLEQSGAFAIVLECVVADLAREITQKARVPTIGIGSGPYTDGQILVVHDLLGMFPVGSPNFVTRYADFFELGKDALLRFVDDVRSGRYPSVPARSRKNGGAKE
jgi:3-methyl-2-oxobutanoate hydroxymethyltransferase